MTRQQECGWISTERGWLFREEGTGKVIMLSEAHRVVDGWGEIRMILVGCNVKEKACCGATCTTSDWFTFWHRTYQGFVVVKNNDWTAQNATCTWPESTKGRESGTIFICFVFGLWFPWNLVLGEIHLLGGTKAAWFMLLGVPYYCSLHGLLL
jgi:hypothetical protein